MRRVLWPAIAAAALFVAWRAAPMFSAESLTAMTPGRPLVALHAANLAALARRVGELPAAKAYLDSKAHDAFADSKLALKLADRADRLSTLAGTPLTISALLDAAKGETAIALYDIGELQFLVLLRLPAVEQAQLAFVANRAQFSQRVYDGRTYYAKIDQAAGLAFLFYQADDLLIVASDADLMEAALAAAKGKPEAQPRLIDDPDYQKLVALEPAIEQSDAALFLDMNRLTRDRYFQAYWAWKNAADFENTPAALAGFSCDGRAVHERRALLAPASPAPAAELTYGGAGLAAYATGGSGVTAQLRAAFGWDLSALGLDEKTAARLTVAAPSIDAASGMIDLARGAALLAPAVEPRGVVEAVAAALREARPAWRKQLTPQVAADGSVALRAGSAGPVIFARRQGDALLLADHEALLDQLAAQLRIGRPGPLRRARAGGDAAQRTADFLRQADQLGEIAGDGAAFAAGPLVDILRAAGNFRRMETAARPVAGGVIEETDWE